MRRPQMRGLFVAPMRRSSGEASTVVAMLRELVDRGHAACVLAADELVQSIRARVAVPVRGLGTELLPNQRLWRDTVDDFAPTHVVFADFPMMAGFPSGVAPLCTPSWTDQLMTMDASVFTLDHLGYGQKRMHVFFGPPHLCRRPVMIPPLPTGMRSLLPCPVHEPGSVAGRRGSPFAVRRSSASLRATREAIRTRTRARLGIADGVMVVHCASQWAQEFCRAFELAYYAVLPRLWDWYFRDAPEPVTVVSVNGVSEHDVPGSSRVRVHALPSMGEHDFGELIGSCDLFLNENPFSSTLGRVVNEGRPAACLVNGYKLVDIIDELPSALRELALELEEGRAGSVFPYRVLPLDFRAELESMQLLHANRFADTFEELEVWGGQRTRLRLWQLLWDGQTRERSRRAQRDYVRAVDALPGLFDVLTASGGGM